MGSAAWLFAISLAVASSDADDRAVAVVREKLGVELAIAESRIRRSIISTDSPYGFLVRSVAPGSLAERSGLRAGDILLEWNGAAIHEVEPLAEWIERAAAERAAIPIAYSRKRPGVPLTFPATNPWEDRRTKLRFDRAKAKRRTGPI
jgi:serine protease Do